MESELARATFAGGCFWCIEAAFKELAGVETVTSGYCGGDVADPTYEAVCSGRTGHAEAVQVTYDPELIGYDELLEVLFTVHDPTQLNRQGPDVGSQYRSAVFYHDEDQREAVEAYVEALDASGTYDEPIVTEIAPLETFYEAEEHHQDYFEEHPNQPYCVFNARPKVEKVRKLFAEKLKAG